MDEEDTRPAPSRPSLDRLGISELERHIADLRAEIARAEAEIARKRSMHEAASSFFKT